MTAKQTQKVTKLLTIVDGATGEPAEKPAHHRFSPSKLKYLSLCAGYEGDDEPSVAAIEGTRLHEAAETGNLDGLDDEQERLVGMCREYGAMIEGTCATVERERRLEILGGRLFGTADVVAVNSHVAHVIDYKFGRVAVDDAETNLQGWAYALGVFDATGMDEVAVHFMAPRRDEVSSAVFYRADDYDRMTATVAGVIDKVEAWHNAGEPASDLNPSPSACKWCAKRGGCPALGGPCVALAERANGGIVIPTETNPALMTTEQLTQALAVEGIVIAWAERYSKAAKVEAMRRLKAGEPVPGYGIKRKSGAREVLDSVSAAAILADQFGFTKDDMTVVMRLRLGDAEKLVASKAGRGKGAAAKDGLNEALDAAGLLTRKADYEYVTSLE